MKIQDSSFKIVRSSRSNREFSSIPLHIYTTDHEGQDLEAMNPLSDRLTSSRKRRVSSGDRTITKSEFAGRGENPDRRRMRAPPQEERNWVTFGRDRLIWDPPRMIPAKCSSGANKPRPRATRCAKLPSRSLCWGQCSTHRVSVRWNTERRSPPIATILFSAHASCLVGVFVPRYCALETR